MRNKIVTTAGAIVVAVMFAVAMTLSAAAQGKGHGGGGGGGAGRGSSGMGQPTGIGVDRGMERSSSGRGNASEKSNGRSDAGLERARVASENLTKANRELNKHPGLANTLHTNANDLRAGYQTALLANPNLKFGQFVAATRLGQNLGGRHPNITRDAILAGLLNGHSIGQTLHMLGLSSQQAKEAQKRAEKEIDQGKK